MAKELVKKEQKNALQELAGRLKVDTNTLQTTLKQTVFRECRTNEEFISAVIVANTYGLNPILKEMYAFPASRGGVIPIVSVDGWISLVNRQSDFDGVELIENDDAEQPGKLGSVTAKFYLKSKAHPIVVTEYMNECYNKDKEPWKKWPRRMLRHKAYIQGARVAFGFSGIYDEDEGQRIIEAEAVASPGKPEVEMPKEITAGPQPEVEVEAKEETEQPKPRGTITDAQISAITKLAEKVYGKEKSYSQLIEHAGSHYGIETIEELTTEQAGELISRLSKGVGKNGK